MATPQWIKDILRGGLPEVLDLGDSAPSTQETPTPERVPPSDVTDRERANPTSNAITNMTSQEILTLTAVIVGGLFVVNMLQKG